MGEATFKNDIYFHYINTKNNADLAVIAFGYERCAKNKEPVGPLEKSNFMVHYVKDGKGYYFLNGKKYLLGSGDIFFAPPETTIHYVQDYDTPWEYIWLEFNGARAMSLCKSSLLSIEEPIFHTKNNQILTSLMNMLDHPTNKLALECHSVAFLYMFFSSIIDERSIDIEKAPSGKALQIENAIKYIDENFTDPDLSLLMISEQLFLNPSYLSRIFKEITGNTISKYIISLRIQKASDYIEEKKYSIKDIASMVGYTNPQFFSKEFKKYRGTNPKNYNVEGIYKE